MTISTHVLDISRGIPAAGVEIVLYECAGTVRRETARARTDAQGRVAGPLGGELAAGEYELEFDAGAYFAAHATRGFFGRVPVRFRLQDAGHYHVPLLISPWGYSTYRGS